MGAFWKGALRFVAGKELGALKGNILKNSWKIASSQPISSKIAHNAWHALKLQLYIGVPLTLLSPGTPEEKMQGLALNLGSYFMTMGMNSPWRQFGWMTALTIMPHMGSVTRGIVQGYRGALESRTSLSIPFSHSTMAMDQAFSTLQYSQSRLQEANSTLTGQAAFMAARYMSR